MSSTTPPKIDLENDQSNNSEDDYMDYFAEVEVEDFDEKEQENEVNQDDGSDGEEEEEEEEEGELIYSGNEGDQEGSGSYQEGGGSDDSPKPVSCDESPKPISSDDTPKPISYDNESRRGDVDDDSNRRDGDDDWERQIFVGGISWKTTGENFAIYFQKYGKVVDAKIMRDRHTGMPRGFGFVTFEDAAVADKVLKDVHVIDGRPVEVRQTHSKKSLIPKTKKIFVGGIPPSLTGGEFKEYFATFGKVVEHEIMIEHATGQSRGFGFITFDNEDIVEEIMSLGIIHEINGKKIELRKTMMKKPDKGGEDSIVGGNMYGRNYRGGGYGYHSRGRFGRRGRVNMHGMYGTRYNYNALYDSGSLGFGSVYGAMPMYGVYEPFFNMNGHVSRGNHGGASSAGGGGSGNDPGGPIGSGGHNRERYMPY